MEDPGNGAQRGYPVLINRVDVLKALAHYQPFVGDQDIWLSRQAQSVLLHKSPVQNPHRLLISSKSYN
ncbi:hypothetical protein K443DRAFT_441557 [Laccaria amethystina LaAM-08-1]|uniref:Uncharacterized protein n=1 Tax=Laccaria amethystina LaAM-08-1 TaxID=1095629 RepID=A0A0C9WWE9_9AGAR|nr:hypothetical protein K443DRAFT_441557 [Laccaria amethystina LaAM-08-1]